MRLKKKNRRINLEKTIETFRIGGERARFTFHRTWLTRWSPSWTLAPRNFVYHNGQTGSISTSLDCGLTDVHHLCVKARESGDSSGRRESAMTTVQINVEDANHLCEATVKESASICNASLFFLVLVRFSWLFINISRFNYDIIIALLNKIVIIVYNLITWLNMITVLAI